MDKLSNSLNGIKQGNTANFLAAKKHDELVARSRKHAMHATVVDLTHDMLPENTWRPIKKEYDRVPPQKCLDDKVLLKEWEMNASNEHYSKIYDRRMIDVDVFKKFAAQGEVIKMAIDPRELTRDKHFWKAEDDIAHKSV